MDIPLLETWVSGSSCVANITLKFSLVIADVAELRIAMLLHPFEVGINHHYGEHSSKELATA